ncbi:MAG: hypothetical protein PHT33_12135 [bacterium]|nr:hypothetical protein [bacterium]
MRCDPDRPNGRLSFEKDVVNLRLVVCLMALFLFAFPAMAAENSPEECLDYIGSYLLDQDYTNAMAWVDYGLRNYPGNLKLEIARFKVVISDTDKSNDATARDRLKSLLSGRSNELNDAVFKALIDSGYYRPNIRLVLPTNKDGADYLPTVVSLQVIAVGLNRIVPKMPEGADVKVALPIMWQPVIWVKNVSDYTVRSAQVSIGMGQAPQPDAGMDPQFSGDPAAPGQPGRSGRSDAAGPGGVKVPRQPGDMPDEGLEPGQAGQPFGGGGPVAGEFTVRPGDVKKVILAVTLPFQGEKLTQPLQCTVTWINKEEDRTPPSLTADRIDPDDIPVFNIDAMEKP